MSPMRTLAGLALVVAIATIAAEARTTGYIGYKVSADIPKDSWEYFDVVLAASDFLGSNDTVDYKLFIETDIDDAFTARLWFGTFDLTDLDAPGEIDSDASGGGRGDRSGQADTPSPDNYVLSVYATCDSCTSVLIEVALHLVDGNDALVPFMIRPNMNSVDLEVEQDGVLVWGFHNTTAADDDIYVQMSLDNELNSVDTIFSGEFYPTAVSDRFPSDAPVDGSYLTDPIDVFSGITYFGSYGVASIFGDIGHHVRLGINEAPTSDCSGGFVLSGADTDYSPIADCVTYDGSISITTSAVLSFSLPNLESITGTLEVTSPLASLSLPALVTADRLTVGDRARDCAVETLSLPSLTTVGTFKVACQGLRAFDLPVATDLGLCDLFWAGEESAEIGIPCGGVLVSSFIPVDLTFMLETATHAAVSSIAFGSLTFPNLVSAASLTAGFNLDIDFGELVEFDLEVGDLQMSFPALTDMDGSVLALSAVDGGEAEVTATIFMPELTQIGGADAALGINARGEVIPVAIVAPNLESITGGLSVEGEASVYLDALETISGSVDISQGTVCMPVLASVGGDFTITMSAETCVLPDVNDIEASVAGTFSAAAAVCTVEECTAPSSLDDSSEAGAASLVAAGGVGLATLVCAAVVAVATAVVVG